MPAEDANRWNLRYQADPRNSFELPRALLVEHNDLLPSHGLALDIAMGLGGNARFLIQRGLRVIGVDVSYIAVRKATSELPTLMAVVADLEQFFIPQNTFDVIINFLYLQRNLWIPIINGLKKGGVLFIECLLEDMLSIHPEINPAYLLKPGELQQVFIDGEMSRNLEILNYTEGWYSMATSHARATSRLVARRVV
ncbi:MAG: methyltransferase domain-containing protein [Anaerolineales bacterium]